MPNNSNTPTIKSGDINLGYKSGDIILNYPPKYPSATDSLENLGTLYIENLGTLYIIISLSILLPQTASASIVAYRYDRNGPCAPRSPP